MRRIALLALLGGLAGLAACESSPQAVQAQDPVVSVRYAGGGEEQAEANADEFCDDRYDRDAALLSRQLQGGVWVATYQCVPD